MFIFLELRKRTEYTYIYICVCVCVYVLGQRISTATDATDFISPTHKGLRRPNTEGLA